MAIASFSLAALDCPDPFSLAEFYSKLTGGTVKHATATDEWVRLEIAQGSDIGFQRDFTYRPPEWPNGTPQQAHLDFSVTDLEVGERAVIAIGATKTDEQPCPDEWRVFLDPVGHPFCLVLVDETATQ